MTRRKGARSEWGSDLLPVMRDEVPNRLEERWFGYALFGRDESDKFNGERFGCHMLLWVTTKKSNTGRGEEGV